MDLTSDCALGDRRGTFRLLHSATAYGTGRAASWAIAPGSGTGELRTIRGQLQILDQHELVLDYDLDG